MKEVKLFTKYDIEVIALKAIRSEFRALENRLRKEFKLKSIAASSLNDCDSIDKLKFSFRVQRTMEEINVKTVGQLVSLTENDLLQWYMFGKLSLREVNRALESHGRELTQLTRGRKPEHEPMRCPVCRMGIQYYPPRLKGHHGGFVHLGTEEKNCPPVGLGEEISSEPKRLPSRDKAYDSAACARLVEKLEWKP